MRASGSYCQIGDYISNRTQTRWFSEKLSHADFCTLDILVAREIWKDIACYETSAQIAILKIAATEFTVGRILLRIVETSIH